MSPAEAGASFLDRLRRAVLRHRSVLVLSRRGHGRDAALLLAALVAELRDLAVATPADPEQTDEARALLDQAEALLGAPEAMPKTDVRRCAALCRRALFALDRARRKAASPRPGRRWRLAALLAGLALVLFAGAAFERFLTTRQAAARLRQATQTVIELANLAGEAKKRRQETLLALTGTSCSECVCKTGRSLAGLPAGDICMANWVKALTGLYEAATGQPARDVAGRLTLPERFARDPWGAPYLLNENEGETPGACDPDVLRSAGPDGLFGTADDIVAAIPPVFCR
jgi:type II secretory pathway pseudopilin PulG